jgi:hypothetical protein
LIPKLKKIFQFANCENDIDCLLKTFFSTFKGYKILSKIQTSNDTDEKSVSLFKQNKTIINVLNMYNKCQNKSVFSKKVILSLVSHVPLKILKIFGFKISQNQFTSARKHSQKFGAGVETPKQIQPLSKQRLNEKFQKSIENFFLSNSSPASNRTIKIKKEIFPVFYTNENYKNLFKKFIDETNINISYSTFYKYKPKQIKTGKKKTDMCNDCEIGKNSKKILKNLYESVHFDCKHGNNENEIYDDCFDEKNLKILENLKKNISYYENHKFQKNQQRLSFNLSCNDKLDDECIFKENISVQQGLVETNHNFYENNIYTNDSHNKMTSLTSLTYDDFEVGTKRQIDNSN